MSDSESAPLTPDSASLKGIDPEPAAPFEDDSSQYIAEDTPQKKKKAPLHLIALYGLSFLISCGGLGCAAWGYGITITAPFEQQSKMEHRASYEEYFPGMQSVVVLLAVNALWTGLNFCLARRGKHEYTWPFTMPYDFLLWALLIAFGVFNMVDMLWDRSMCDGRSDSWEGSTGDELYRKCDNATYKLLVVEMVAVNLGLLVAVIHFILLIAGFCTFRQHEAEGQLSTLRRYVRQERETLLVLMERRKLLTEETEQLEARKLVTPKPLPSVPNEPTTSGSNNGAEEEEQQGQNLIDLEGREGGGLIEGHNVILNDYLNIMHREKWRLDVLESVQEIGSYTKIVNGDFRLLSLSLHSWAAKILQSNELYAIVIISCMISWGSLRSLRKRWSSRLILSLGGSYGTGWEASKSTKDGAVFQGLAPGTVYPNTLQV